MTDSLENLVTALRMLPSVGERSAWRMAMYLMEQDSSISKRLATALTDAKSKLRRCTQCNTWTENDLCDVCASPSRKHSVVCVVERPTDMWALEKSQRFDGVYHVLGGVLSPMHGITVDKLAIQQLIDRVNSGEITEVILGLGGSSEAETTAHYLSRLLSQSDVVVSRFARGLAAGMDIEYADRFTLDQALRERTRMTYGENND